MKKNYIDLAKVFAAALLFTTARVDAQVATLYSFTQSSGTYSAVTGGTVFGTTSSDDQLYVDPSNPTGGYTQTGSGIPIGFNFMFNNHTYDRIAINNNGWMTFGNSSSFPSVNITSSYQGISYTSGAPADLQNAIAGLSYDILAQANASIVVQTIGSSPTRTCIVQFANYRKWSSGSGDSFNFQIRLSETTNIVEIQYGNFVSNSSGITPQVGIRGDSNSDFQNITTNNTNTWSNPLVGTTNNAATASSNPTLVPTSGQIYRWTPPQCSGGLSSLTATGNRTLVCPNGGVNLGLLNSYTVSGIVYAWSVGTSSVGPFTVIPNSNGAQYFANGITTQQWFQNTAVCINGGAATTTSSAFGVQVAATTTNTVPYYESFEGIVSNNELPNCSWLSTNPGSSAQTYTSTLNYNRSARTGSKYATFVAAYVSGTNYFYSNGIQLNAGVTYSASMWYKTEINGYTNVTNLSLMYGSTQTTTGLVNIITDSPASSPVYKPLANTFTVATSGIYYIAVKATTNGNYGAQYLVWDDLEVIVPCDLNPIAVALTTNSTTICSGQTLDLSATGADTYTWSTGEMASTINPIATNSGVYYVVGTSTLSGCTSTVSQYINVNQSPSIFAYASSASICYGKQSTLYASGATSYVWTGGNNPNSGITVVTPTVTTTYSVTGTNAMNCSNTETVMITVNPNPTITVSSNVTANTICKGETAELSGSGAPNFNFATNMGFFSGSPIIVTPQATTIYSVTGISSLGCEGKTTFILNVEACVGLNQVSKTLSGLSVYPNPTTGIFTVELPTNSAKTIVVTDIAGRVVLNTNSTNEKININLNAFANGIYYVKVQSEDAVDVIKIVKN